MRKILLVAALTLITHVALAQDPKLKASQSLSLTAISEKWQALQDQAKQLKQIQQAISQEIDGENPGYHYDLDKHEFVKVVDKKDSKDAKSR